MANEIEKRIVTSKLQLRAAPAGSKSPGVLFGYAAKYNTYSQDLGGFYETIKPGAFDRALREKHDVRCLLNHDPNVILGRSKSGTLALKSDTVGLYFTCELPDTQAARDLHASISRGDIGECSFAFKVADGGEQWNHATITTEKGTEKSSVRTLTDVNLFDVSAVTYPAYEDTSVSARSRRAHYDDSDAAFRERVRALGAKIAADDAAADDFDYRTATPEAIRLRVRRVTERIQRDALADAAREAGYGEFWHQTFKK